MSVIPRVLIVGAGATGSITAALIQKEIYKVSVAICEKSRGSGGRMNTSRSESDRSSTLDLGAQYISCVPTYATLHSEFYDELLTNNILKPLTFEIEGLRKQEEGTKDYIAPNGMNSIVKYFIQKSEVAVNHNTHLNRIDVAGKDEEEKLIAKYNGGNDEECKFDVVLLTIPVQQLLQIEGSITNILENNSEVLQKLKKVEYSCRYALGLYFDAETKLEVPFVGKYLYDNPCIRWISFDNKKRGRDTTGDKDTLLVHTSVPFTLEHLEDDKEDVKQLILRHLSTILPNLPNPIEVKCHRWRYSQVHKGVEGRPGCLALTQSKNTLILAAGDAFIHSNLDGCIESAKLSCKAIIDFLKSNGRL